MFPCQLLPLVLTGNDSRVANALLQIHKFIFYSLHFIYKHVNSSLSLGNGVCDYADSVPDVTASCTLEAAGAVSWAIISTVHVCA